MSVSVGISTYRNTRAFTIFIFSSTPLFVAATTFAIFVLRFVRFHTYKGEECHVINFCKRGGQLTAEIAFPAIGI